MSIPSHVRDGKYIEGGAFGTPGTEADNKIVVTLQVSQPTGQPPAKFQPMVCYLSGSDEGTNVVTTAEGLGIPTGGRGTYSALVANVMGRITPDDNGFVDIEVSETSTTDYHVVVILPDGTRIISAVLDFS